MPPLHAHAAPTQRRGAALLLSLLVLLVLVVIMSQLNISTVTEARVARNDLALTAMDFAIESALLEVNETLAADAESGGGEDPAAGGAGGAAGGADIASALAGASGAGGGAGGEQGGGSVDSRVDDWATPMRTEINGIRLRILIQDEDSKLNVLTMLSEDELEAEKAFERVVRVLDLCRHGTEADIDTRRARALAEEMRRHLLEREDSFLPRPNLLTDDEERRGLGLPLSLREFVVLEGFTEDLFQDFLDEDGTVVHSIASFLTTWTGVRTREQHEQQAAEAGAAPPAQDGAGAAPPSGQQGSTQTSGSEDGGPTAGDGDGGVGVGPTGTEDSQGTSGGAGGGDSSEGAAKAGIAVNLNTAPLAVLRALMDDRDVTPRLWDDVLEYRNEEDEEALGEDEDPPLDEFGEPIVIPKIFESLADLEEFDDYRDLDALIRGELDNLLTVESQVFSIFVTARKPTGSGAGLDVAQTREEMEAEERSGQALSRTVRCVVWRRRTGDGFECVPLERWEVLSYMPYEVQDFPDEDRR